MDRLIINSIFLFLIVEKSSSTPVKSIAQILTIESTYPVRYSMDQNDHSSQPKCGIDELFHNETRACYSDATATAFTSSSQPDQNNPPCAELMLFYRESAGSSYGVCDCINDDDCRYRVNFHRPVLSWPKSNRCYFAYDQGPCKPGQWLVMNGKTFQSECSTNPCLGKPTVEISPELRLSHSNAKTDVFYFQKNGTCYQTFTQAYCKPDEYVRFLRNHPVPFCAVKETGYGCPARPQQVSIGTTARLPCPQGHKRVGDECTPIANFQ